MTAKTKAIVETTAEVAEKTIDQVKAGVEQAHAAFKTQMEEAAKHVALAQKQFEAVVELGRGNLEAMLKATSVLTEGMQEIARTLLAAQQTAFDETMANAKALASAKSLREAMDLQMTFAKSAMDKLVAEAGKLSEHGAKLAEKAFAPVAERVNAAVTTLTRPLAA
ncbi:MAG: phasin family protein [Elioraea sp.]|nr:phasin family protein [Elioraea sp.]